MKKTQDSKLTLGRRKFLGSAAALSASMFLPSYLQGNNLSTPNRLRIDGVNLGVITYSFRSMPGTAEDLLGYIAELGLNSVELMGDPAEQFAGAPKMPRWRRNMTPEQRAEREAQAKAVSKWRLSAPMDRYKLLKKKFKAEGIKIEVVKFPLDRLTDGEIDYCFKVAKALGAKGITLERSDEAMEKLAPFASKHKRMIGYHNHAKVNFNSWDEGIKLSKHQALNLDVGHYIAGTNESPIPLIEKYHDRILNLHLKDRKKDNGPNMPWGEGDTPLKEILQLLKRENYKFMAAIELEYKIPEGSDAVKEVKKCIDFCREAVG